MDNLEEGLEIKQSLAEIQKLKAENEEALAKGGGEVAEIKQSMETNQEYWEKLQQSQAEN